MKNYFKKYIDRIKNLEGGPHHIALGMAVGVFVAFTPIFPFQTFVAIGIAFALRCSRAAAAIGSLFNNPLTIPFIYFGSYKIGFILLGRSCDFDIKEQSIADILSQGADIALAMIAGGAVLGVIPCLATYFITKKIFIELKSRKK